MVAVPGVFAGSDTRFRRKLRIFCGRPGGNARGLLNDLRRKMVKDLEAGT
jgi:hypothetical protein